MQRIRHALVISAVLIWSMQESHAGDAIPSAQTTGSDAPAIVPIVDTSKLVPPPRCTSPSGCLEPYNGFVTGVDEAKRVPPSQKPSIDDVGASTGLADSSMTVLEAVAKSGSGPASNLAKQYVSVLPGGQYVSGASTVLAVGSEALKGKNAEEAFFRAGKEVMLTGVETGVAAVVTVAAVELGPAAPVVGLAAGKAARITVEHIDEANPMMLCGWAGAGVQNCQESLEREQREAERRSRFNMMQEANDRAARESQAQVASAGGASSDGSGISMLMDSLTTGVLAAAPTVAAFSNATASHTSGTAGDSGSCSQATNIDPATGCHVGHDETSHPGGCRCAN